MRRESGADHQCGRQPRILGTAQIVRIVQIIVNGSGEEAQTGAGDR